MAANVYPPGSSPEPQIEPVVVAPVVTSVTLGPDTIAKAVVAGTGALGVAIISAVADGHVTVWEIVLGALAAIGTAAGTWATSNKRVVS
jgi:hypothetical protein